MLQRLEPGSTDYNLVSGWQSEGPADPARVAAALRDVARRHEILRSCFVDDGGAPAVRVLPPERVVVDVVDLGALSPEEQQRALRAALEVATHAPFDLTTEPPVRFTVNRIAGERVVVMIAAHHIAVDDWSLDLLRREIGEAVTGAVRPPPALQYVDYAAWQRALEGSPAAAVDLAFWKARLAGVPPLSTLPTDRPRSERATGAVHDVHLGRELSDGIKALARAEGATVYMTLVAACAAVLRWHTGQDDLLLASPMGVRERPELEAMIGPFVNLLVLRLDLSGDPSFAEVVRRTRAAVLDAHEHRDVPFEKLVEQLRPVRSPDHSPLVQVAVVQHSAPVGSAAPMYGGGAIFDLTFFIREVDGRLDGGIEYRSDLYTAESIAAVAARIEVVLAAAVADRQRRLSAISLLTPAEGQLVLEAWNDTARDVDLTPFAVQLARQAALTPDATAVVFEGAQLVYRELSDGIKAVARAEGATV